MSSSSSSFFSFKPQPQIRQEGFHLPSPPPSDPNHPNHHHQAHPSSPSSSSSAGTGGGNGSETLPSLLAEPFRKFTHLNSQSSMGFTDELASLIDNGSGGDVDLHSNVSHERSTHPHSHTHNIFDISAPKSSVGGGGGGGSSGYFNSTLPALNSSLRFEHPDSQSLGGRHSPTLPLSLPVSLPPLPHSSSSSSQTPTSGSYASSRPAHHRHSTSTSTSASSPHLHHPLSHRSRHTHNSSRSRSTSRGPSLTPAIPSLNMNIGGMGPIAIPPTSTQNGGGMDASSPTSTSGSTMDGLGTSLTSNVGPTRTSHRGERRDSSASSTLSPSTLNNINMGNMNLNSMNMGMNMFGGGMSFNSGNGNSGIGIGFNSDVPRRGRRGNSVSSNISEISTTASPPPHHHHNQHMHQQNANRQQSPSMSHHPRPIVIPAGGIAGGPGTGANGGGWFMNSQSSEFSLPTPESLHSPLIHHLSQHPQQNAQTFSSFGISPPLDKELGRRSSSHLRSNINGNDNGDDNENDNADIDVDGDRDNDDGANGNLNNSNQPNGNGVGLPPLSGIAGGVPIPSIGSLGSLYSQQSRQQSQQRNGQHHVGSPTSPILSSSLGGMGGGNFGNMGNMGNLNMGGMSNMGGMGGMGGMNINMGINMNSMGGMGNMDIGTPPAPIAIPSHSHSAQGHGHSLSHSLSHSQSHGLAMSPTSLGHGPVSPHPSHQPQSQPHTQTLVTSSDKQALLANEKRRKRRESHNAVERRRRDNINEKISELATLIPECMLDPTAPNALPTSSSAVLTSPLSPTDEDGAMVARKKEDGGADKNTGGGSGGEGDQSGIVKANKGMILRKSVEYIRYLQQLVSAQGARNRELEQQLKMYRSSSATASSPDGGVSSSAAMNGDGPIHQMHTPSSSNNDDGSRSPKSRIRQDGVDDDGVEAKGKKGGRRRGDAMMNMGMGMGMSLEGDIDVDVDGMRMMLHDEVVNGDVGDGGYGGYDGAFGMESGFGVLESMPERGIEEEEGDEPGEGRQRDRDQEEEEDEDPMEMDIEGGRLGKTSSKVKPKVQRMEDGAVGVERGRRRRDSVKVGARSGGLTKKRVKEERDVDMDI